MSKALKLKFHIIKFFMSRTQAKAKIKPQIFWVKIKTTKKLETSSSLNLSPWISKQAKSKLGVFSSIPLRLAKIGY